VDFVGEHTTDTIDNVGDVPAFACGLDEVPMDYIFTPKELIRLLSFYADWR